jgi:hypothetical protein
LKLSIHVASATVMLLLSEPASAASFAPPSPQLIMSDAPFVRVEHHGHTHPYRPIHRFGYGTRHGSARFYGPRGYVGRPYWYTRAWYARPYYGTIVAGVALGTLITVAAIGYAPVRPASNLCWYWSAADGVRGYWDYCARPTGA